MTRAGASGWRFRPTLWPTVFAVPAALLLVSLGVWQLQRLERKEALIAELAVRMEAPAIHLPKHIIHPTALEYRRVVLMGRFIHDKEMYLTGRSYAGMAGFHVVTPFLLQDGRTVLVDRGWVPVGRKDPLSRSESQVEGPIRLAGVVRLAGWQGRSLLKPESWSGRDTWVYVDGSAMAKKASLVRPITEVYVDAESMQGPGRLPVGGQTQMNLRNDHLQYAVTWFSLALALVIIYLLYHIRSNGTAWSRGS